MDTRVRSMAMEELIAAAEIPFNPSLRRWKEQGGKVIGCFYHYLPEEIITAAGLLPYRMRATGSTGTELSESCFTQINCSFVRHLFDSAIRGHQGFVDGIVTVNNCDHIRRLFDNWKRKIRTPYMHFLVFPKKSGNEQIEVFRKELASLRMSLEEYFDVHITDERIEVAIKLHNETRRLQRKLYDLRKSNTPPVTGAETLAIMVAGTAMSREQYNSLLTQVLEDCSHAIGRKDHTSRIMLVGGEIDDPRLVEVIESQGALVVTDSLGYGSRSMWNDVSADGDPLTALARYQLMERPPDPRIYGTSFARNEYVKKVARDFNVDGVISVRLPQCDLWGLEQVNLVKYLKRNRLPHLALETEYILGSAGQLRTRVQAFLESIGGHRQP
jgi:benzoyl-CoA reductase/2-hydroxyglutaryl-CoA dehydratase subunit BcrC/BadD/HgdB